jgi:hypothetical protein
MLNPKSACAFKYPESSCTNVSAGPRHISGGKGQEALALVVSGSSGRTKVLQPGDDVVPFKQSQRYSLL